MEKVVRIFKCFEEAGEAERRDYAALTIQQRVDITMELVSWWDTNAWRLLGSSITVLKQAYAPFLVIGGYAYGGHGICRCTPDLDIWMERDDNLVNSILEQLGLILTADLKPASMNSSDDLAVGKEPNRVHIHNAVTSLEFGSAFQRGEPATLYGHSIKILCRADLVSNKRALRRLYDLADLEALGEK